MLALATDVASGAQGAALAGVTAIDGSGVADAGGGGSVIAGVGGGGGVSSGVGGGVISIDGTTLGDTLGEGLGEVLGVGQGS